MGLFFSPPFARRSRFALRRLAPATFIKSAFSSLFSFFSLPLFSLFLFFLFFFFLIFLFYRGRKNDILVCFPTSRLVIVSNHLGQNGSGTPFNERTGVSGGFRPGNLLRTTQKGFFLTETRDTSEIFRKKNRIFYHFDRGD